MKKKVLALTLSMALLLGSSTTAALAAEDEGTEGDNAAGGSASTGSGTGIGTENGTGGSSNGTGSAGGIGSGGTVKTGDQNNIALRAVLGCASLTACTVVLMKRKRSV